MLEWISVFAGKSAKNICGEIENDQGEKMTLEIPSKKIESRHSFLIF